MLKALRKAWPPYSFQLGYYVAKESVDKNMEIREHMFASPADLT
jgi:hypothetical protein